ncbi:MAG: hypothetical protein M3071_18405 [Actinomycetota bacterium]|nr:hypothetical protein [Actinomycetota bacterium]
MNEPDEHEHEREPLIDEYRNLFANDDPVPPLVTETAKASLGWRRLDADLAELLTDSSLEDEAVARARGAGATVRAVSFSSGRLTIDVEISGEGSDVTVLGQLSPPAHARIEVQTPDEPASAVANADELGRFRIKLPVAKAFRLRVATGDPAEPKWIETSWIPL